jgi:hypothetical protein
MTWNFETEEPRTTDHFLVGDLLSVRSKSKCGIVSYPERWKCLYAFLQYFIRVLCPSLKCRMGSVMRLRYSHSRPTLLKNLLFNSLVYAQLQIFPLYSHKHEAENVTRERIGSHFDKSSALLAKNLHSCGTDISKELIDKEKPSLSTRTNNRVPSRLD